MKPIFNYFTAGTCVKFTEDDIKILVVQYYDSSDHKRVNEIRLSGGTVQHGDISIAIEKSACKIGLRPDQLDWILKEIFSIEAQYKKEIESMPSMTNQEKIAIRNIFVASITSVEEAVGSFFLNEEKIKIIELEAKLATLRRELKEETATTTFKDAIECGFAERNGHFQYPFLVLDSDAPDRYTGSSDPDIKESFYMPLKEVCEKLYRNHQPLFRNTINQLADILRYNKDKEFLIEKINLCLQPN